MNVSQRLVAQLLFVALLLTAVVLLIFGARTAMVAGITAVTVAVFAAVFVGRSVSRPVADLSEVARALAGGDFGRRPALAAPGEIGELATAVYRLSEQLQLGLAASQTEQALQNAMFESLNEGVLVLDGQGRVVRINQSGRQLLEMGDVALPATADLLPRDRGLHQVIGAALRGEASAVVEISAGDRRLSVIARPLDGRGAVVALFDLTQIRRLEQMRRDFVANVSHELRTPLTVISGFAETLAEEGLPPDRRREFAELVRGHAQRMQRIVDDLLDLSRMESGGWSPAPVTIDVRGIAGEAMQTVRRTADAKGLELAVDVDPAAAEIHADRTALRQVLVNLLDNAVRHTDQGNVAIFTQADAGGSWIGVRDTGPGIATEHLPRIFERFYRADVGRSRERGGTGLGLAIVRHLVESHGGRVRAESEVGRGTTIAVYLPRGQSF